ncbi:MAG: hypothetical protein HY505_02370 [Candidatus Yanofskybacteria bacterium]|nr:hypothetical protein [Candidatus Yanofskybacteria bacterium]
MNTALATRPTKGSVVQFRPNQNIERHMQVLHKSKQELESINKNIRKFLGLELGWGHTIFGRVFGRLVPKKFYGVMPAAILKWVAEEADVLEQIEGMMRECINNNQEAVANIATCALTEAEELQILIADIETAEREGWSARQLQEYMAAESQIAINPAIAQLLDEKFNIFTDAQKEGKKKELIEQLKILALTRRKLIETLGSTCDAGLGQLNAAVGQYYAYSRVYRPTAVIRNSAKDMLQTDQSLYAARQVLMTTISASVNAIENIIKSAGAVNEYHIASTEFHRLLDESNKRIDTGLAELEKRETGYRRATLNGITVTPVPVRQLPESTTVKVENS